MKGSKLGIRLLYYFGGFFVMTIGIALSVKSNLGVSPVSSIPYTMTCVWGIEMGVATVIFHVILVILQMLLMRRRFECKNLLQIPVGMVFGAFTHLQHARGNVSLDGQPDYPFADVLDCHCFRCNRYLFLRSGGHYAAGR